jgi:hypothetical protein
MSSKIRPNSENTFKLKFLDILFDESNLETMDEKSYIDIVEKEDQKNTSNFHHESTNNSINQNIGSENLCEEQMKALVDKPNSEWTSIWFILLTGLSVVLIYIFFGIKFYLAFGVIALTLFFIYLIYDSLEETKTIQNSEKNDSNYELMTI